MKRKTIYFGLLAVLLIVCLYSGWMYNQKSYTVFDRNMSELKGKSNPGEARMVSAVTDSASFFLNLRKDRELARTKAIDGYNKLIQNPDISVESRTKCEEALSSINADIIKEADAEAIIKSKGIKDVIVFINSDAVTVTVNSPKLTSPEISRIKDVLSEFVSTKNIKIVEVG